MPEPDDAPAVSQAHLVGLISALQEREHQLAEAQRLAHMGSWSWDLTTDEATWSDELYRILGFAPGGPTARYRQLLAMVRVDRRDEIGALVESALRDGADMSFACPMVLDDGSERWLDVMATVDRDVTGTATRIYGVVRDVTDAHAVERAMRELRGMFEVLVECSSDILTIVNDDGTIRYTSPSAHDRLGYEHESRHGAGLGELIHPDDIVAVRRAMGTLRSSPREVVTFESRFAHADGSWRILESTGRNRLDDPGVRGFVFTSRDVTEGKALEVRLSKEVLHDPLTGLPNRALLSRLAVAALARATRRGWTTALMAIDIDDFRSVNDDHGLAVGDEVLAEAAARLDHAFRVEDGVARGRSVARSAGDEFLVVCEGVHEQGIATTLGVRIAAALAEPFDVDSTTTITLTASVGIALAPPGTDDLDALLHEAESAMRKAKERGGNACEVFDDDLRQAETARAEAKAGLQAALENGELRLFFQPKVSLTTDLMIGAEALLRWDHPTRGLVPPMEFIPLAEETGLIVPIGAWVIEEACRHAARWRDDFPGRPPFVVCVNVSVRQLGPHLVDTVTAALADTGLSSSGLVLEVTESMLMGDVAGSLDVIHDLRQIGVALAIDDFGTGHSSLSYLKQLDLHELKIDKSFIDGLGRDPNDTSIVAAVIALAHALELVVVAEGVETVDQLERLRSLGCEVGQGYLFARPSPPAGIDELLQREASASWVGRGRAPEHDGDAAPFRAERVLVVDDSPEIRQLARLSLTAVGIEVHEAVNGRDGIDAAKAIVPDCILLDVMMPEIGGMEACRLLRADPRTAGCTIVMLTANSDAADKVAAFSNGADDYVIKPFSPRDLSTRVHAAMRRRTAGATGRGAE